MSEKEDDGVDLMWLIVKTSIPDDCDITTIEGMLWLDPTAVKGVWVENVGGEYHVSLQVEGVGTTLQKVCEVEEDAVAEAKRMRRWVAEARLHNAGRGLK